MNSVVITSINEISEKLKQFFIDCNLIVIGDKKSVTLVTKGNFHFLSVENQGNLDYKIVEKLPFNHYTRKNIGYLEALRKNSQFIYDTDDDNFPYQNWGFPKMNFSGEIVSEVDYYNSYLPFTEINVWPRGFPLNRIREQNKKAQITEGKFQVGVWQGLADIDPDVDAIYRLLDYKPVHFEKRDPFVLDTGVYCPFNSQNTWWQREMLPYAYLPSTVSFRFTDILRGYIAQRCLWEHGLKLGFTEANVYQKRNDHDLMKDFESEISCYLQVEKVVQVLNDLSLNEDFNYNLKKIYSALAKHFIVQTHELEILDAWLKDLDKVL